MSKAESTRAERRTAKRYRVPGSARVFWGGEGTPVAISDVSAGGCLVAGAALPEVGTRVFLSLDIGGLPNVRLPATTVRRVSDSENESAVAAVRFDVPVTSTGGLDRLLSQFVHPDSAELAVLVVDANERSRERIASAVRKLGAQVWTADSARAALEGVRELEANIVLARADTEGLAVLAALRREWPGALRIAFGRKHAIDTAIDLGVAQAWADDPCSAKHLSELLRRSVTRKSS